jgi:hypothetical protein
MSEKTFNTVLGLPLPRKALRVLKNAGIYAPAMVTLEHQYLAMRYVVRGLEAGGAIPDLGRYVTFAGPDGERIAYLHPVESIAVNGLHAVVIAPVLVRVDMLRKGRTYEVLITEHNSGEIENGSRRQLETTILFRGVHGRIELDLAGKDKTQAGSVIPTFYSLASEPIPIPKKFVGVLKAAVRGANCLRCTHSHYLLRLKAAAVAASVVASQPANGMSADALPDAPTSAPPIETASEGHSLKGEVQEMATALSSGSREE